MRGRPLTSRVLYAGVLSFCARVKLRVFAALGAILLLLPVPIYAHEGPPYPVLVDKVAGPCIVSVWADPDVGTGTFLIYAEPLPGKSVPRDLEVDVAVRPVSDRLREATTRAERENLSDREQFKALVPFDAQEYWNVRVLLHSATGDGEAAMQVEVTPPGYGRWDLLIYLLPFLAVGFLWLRAFTRNRSMKLQARLRENK
jgi:hypothetical protein